MTHPKNARDPNQHHKNAATIAISIAATKFVGNPLSNFPKIFQTINYPV